MTRLWRSLAGAGLFTGACAWALHQQVGYILASWACHEAAGAIWLSGAVAVILLLGGAVLSGQGWRAACADRAPEEPARPRRFIATVALMASALFLFAMLLQIAAAFFLPGCVG